MTVLRVAAVQRFCTPYRLPVFQRLACRPGIDLTLFHGRGKAGGQWQDVGEVGNLKAHRLLTLSTTFGVDGHDHLLSLHPAVLWHLSRGRFDAVLAEGTTNLLDNLGIATWCRLSNTPLVFWDAGRFADQPLGLARKTVEPLARRLLRRAQACVTYGRSTVPYFLDIGVKPESVFVAPNTIDLQPLDHELHEWEGRRDELEALKASLGLVGRKVFLHIGSLQRGKPLDSLFAACVRVCDAIGPMGVLIVGDGADRSRLERVVLDLRLDGVRFLGRQTAGLGKYALISDLAVFPHGATLGIVMALALGLPVLAGRGRSPEHEAIVEGVNGMLTAPGDAAGMAAALEGILRRRIQFASSQKIREMVQSGFSLERMVDGLEAALMYAAAGKVSNVRSVAYHTRAPR